MGEVAKSTVSATARRAGERRNPPCAWRLSLATSPLSAAAVASAASLPAFSAAEARLRRRFVASRAASALCKHASATSRSRSSSATRMARAARSRSASVVAAARASNARRSHSSFSAAASISASSLSLAVSACALADSSWRTFSSRASQCCFRLARSRDDSRNARALASSRARVADATEAGVRGATLALARNREGPRAALPTTTASEYGSSDSESYVNPRARVRALAGVSSARGVDSIARRGFFVAGGTDTGRAECGSRRPTGSCEGRRGDDVSAADQHARGSIRRPRGDSRARERSARRPWAFPRRATSARAHPSRKNNGVRGTARERPWDGGGGPRRTTRVSVRGRTSRRSRAKKASGEGPNRARRVRADEARVAEWPSLARCRPGNAFPEGELGRDPS